MNITISTLVRNLVILGAAVALCGCATTKRDWQKANREGTIQAYEQFLQNHPDAKQAAEATHKLEELRSERDWKNAESSNTINGFRLFLKKHPDSEHTPEVKQKLQAELDAQQRADIRTWNLNTACDYLDKHPNGRFLKDVLETIKKRNLATILKKESSIVSAVAVSEHNEIEVVKRYELRGMDVEPVGAKIKAKPGNTLLTVACHITRFGNKKLFLTGSQIALVQDNGTEYETITRDLAGGWGAGSETEITGADTVRINGTATVFITSEVPVSARHSLKLNLMGNLISIASIPQEQ